MLYPKTLPQEPRSTTDTDKTLGLGPPSQVGRAGLKVVTWEFQGIPGAKREKNMGDGGRHWAVPFSLGLAWD